MLNLYVSVLINNFFPVNLAYMNLPTLEEPLEEPIDAPIDENKHNPQKLGLLLAYLKKHDYCFTTISPASHEKVNNRLENALAKNLADIFGWNRVFSTNAVEAYLFDLMQTANILTKVDSGWKSRLRVASIDSCINSSINTQLFLHSAYPTTDNEAVFFGPDTYRFATAIHHFLSTNKQPIYTAVDIGTGSGAGAVLLAQALPQAEIIAADINNTALNLARVNSDAADIHNIKQVHSDLLKDITGNFDLIIANPPYLVDKTKRTYRHGGGALGSALSLDIVDAAMQRLNAGGALLLYTGVAIVDGHDAFLAEVKVKLKHADFTFNYSEIDPDIFGEELLNETYSKTDRIAAVVLTARKQAG